MKKEMYAVLTATVLLTISGGVVHAAESAHELSEVVVTGERDKSVLPGGFVKTEANVGLLGNKNVMETPFSVTSFTEKTLSTFGGPDKPQDSIFVQSPSVRQTGSILHGDFLFRGFRTNGTNYYVNGVPGVLTQFTTPTHIFNSIDLVSGANVGLFGTGVQYESTAPGGVVSGTTKKAPDEGVFNYTQTISGRGLFGEYIDWGKRFGDNDEWGVRIMTENVNGKTSVKGTKMVAQSIYANIDHRGEKSRDNLFFGYRNLEIQKGIRWFMLDGSVTKLPTVPNGANDYGYDGMIKGTNGWMAVYNHEQKFNEHWDGFVNIGWLDNDLDKNVMAGGGGGYTLMQDGTFKVDSKAGGTPQKYYYWQAGTTAHYNTGVLKHDITFSYNQAMRNREIAYANGENHSGSNEVIGSGSLYTGIHLNSKPDTFYLRRMNNKTQIKSIGIVDSMKYNKWDFIVGIHKHKARSSQYSYNGQTNNLKGISITESDATSPTYGFVYRPNDNTSIYASHSEFFDVGSTVPDDNNHYINRFEILPPIKTKQNEIGIKYKRNELLWTLAYYDIKQDNNVKVQKTDGLYFLQDGEVRHKGLELSVNGRIANKWSAFAAVSHLDARTEKTDKGLNDGKRENGTSEWTATAGFQYEPSEKWSILGRAVYTGRTPVYNERFYAPGYIVYDLGVSHKTEIAGVPTTLSLMCYNLFDKDYWMVSRGNQVYLSLPRTFTFTAQFSF